MKTIIIVASFILLLSSSSYANDVLKIGQPVDPISDISARVLVKAYQRIGIEIKPIELPAERSLINSNNGSLDGEVNRIKGIDRKYKNLLMVPIPVNSFEGVVFTKNYSFSVEGWGSLKPYTIAIRTGAKFAEKGTSGMRVYKFTTYDKVFELIAKDRYDVCVSSRVVGFYQINKQNLVGIRVLEPPLERFHLYHYLHKKHKELVPKISASLKRMAAEGAILRERENYIIEMRRKSQIK